MHGLDIFAGVLIFCVYPFRPELLHISETSCPLPDCIFLRETGEQLKDPSADRPRFTSEIAAASLIFPQEHKVDQEHVRQTQSGPYNHTQ